MVSLIDCSVSIHKLYFGLMTKRLLVLHLLHFIKHSLIFSFFALVIDSSADMPGFSINPHCLHIVRFISGSLQVQQLKRFQPKNEDCKNCKRYATNISDVISFTNGNDHQNLC